MTYSESFDNADWTKTNSTITANADISPDGYTNADRIYDDAADAQHRVSKNISVVSATTYTFSVFAKKGSLRYCYLLTTASGAGVRYYFDLQDGVSLTAGGKIEDYGSGWYRISAQVTAAATGNEVFAFNLTDETRFPTYSGTGTGYHMIYGYQVEAGSYVSSYIGPTLGSAVTRGADLAYKTGITSLIGQLAGTFYAEWTATSIGDVSEISLSAGTNQDAIRLRQTSGGALQLVVNNSGISQASIFTAYAVQIGSNYKLAVGYAANDFVFYVNGEQIGTDNSGTPPTCSQFQTDRGTQDGANLLIAKLNQVLLFKTRLTNAQLAELTTL